MNKREFNFKSEEKIQKLDDFLYKYEWLLDSQRSHMNDIYFMRFTDENDEEGLVSILFKEIDYSFTPRLNKPFPFKK